MKLTTKGRYAVMAMADLALFKGNGPTNLTDISLRQNGFKNVEDAVGTGLDKWL